MSAHPTDVQDVHFMVSENTEALAHSALRIAPIRNLEHFDRFYEIRYVGRQSQSSRRTGASCAVAAGFRQDKLETFTW
jgi:hypothetical protein